MSTNFRGVQAGRSSFAVLLFLISCGGSPATPSEVSKASKVSKREQSAPPELANQAEGRTSRKAWPKEGFTQSEEEVDRHRGRILELPLWYAEAAGVPRGGEFCIEDIPSDPWRQEEEKGILRTLGYRSSDTWCFERAASLSNVETLILSTMPTLPEIDAVVISSVFRPALADQYLYRTLRSLLREFPPEVQVNVFVGGANSEYASLPVLQQQVGVADASRVHVVEVGPGTAEFFEAEQVPTKTRATWNLARILSSYTGIKRLLFLEDDVEFAVNSIQQLRPWLTDESSDALVLFNRHCRASATVRFRQDSQLGMESRTLQSFSGFPTTQAVLFSGPFSRRLGHYMLPVSYFFPYDNLIGQALGPAENSYSMIYPSVVQHFGFSTTGLSAANEFPYSVCFQAYFQPKRIEHP